MIALQMAIFNSQRVDIYYVVPSSTRENSSPLGVSSVILYTAILGKGSPA